MGKPKKKRKFFGEPAWNPPGQNSPYYRSEEWFKIRDAALSAALWCCSKCQEGPRQGYCLFVVEDDRTVLCEKCCRDKYDGTLALFAETKTAG